jgi:hypothetical protein
MDVLFQFGGNDWFSWIFFMIMWMVFLVFYPRLMLSQIVWKLEKSARELEKMSDKSKKFIIDEISKNPSKNLKESVDRFFEFFMIEPVSLDPAGIVRKLDHIVQEQKDRFEYFVSQVAPDMNKEKQACIQMGFAGGITVHEISKVVRHYVELVRKTKSIQIAMVLQMQLPLIERIAKSMFDGTKALTKGDPIGDSIGPYVAAKLMGEAKTKEIEEEILMAQVNMDGRKAFVLKATGPGGRIGRPGKAVEKLVSQNRIARIITIDAATKLEGEKTGMVAEGVGVAMGGPGVERSYIEEVAVKRKLPLDSIIVKMSPEEAITPMRKKIRDAYPKIRESLKRSLERTKKGDSIIIVGVGNTSGVGNNEKETHNTDKWVEAFEKKLEAEKKKRKKTGGESSFY